MRIQPGRSAVLFVGHSELGTDRQPLIVLILRYAQEKKEALGGGECDAEMWGARWCRKVLQLWVGVLSSRREVSRLFPG
jgi:hypothetical protein